MTSGAMIASAISLSRRKKRDNDRCWGSGMFGWRETQVHANKVTRQLSTTLKRVRHCSISLQDEDIVSKSIADRSPPNKMVGSQGFDKGESEGLHASRVFEPAYSQNNQHGPTIKPLNLGALCGAGNSITELFCGSGFHGANAAM